MTSSGATVRREIGAARYRIVRRGLARWVSLFGIANMGACVVATITTTFPSSTFDSVRNTAACLAVGSLILAALIKRFAIWRSTTVAVDGEEIECANGKSTRRTAIGNVASGLSYATNHAELTLRNRDVLEFVFANPHAADALLAAARVDAQHQRYSLSIGSRSRRIGGAIVTFVTLSLLSYFQFSRLIPYLGMHAALVSWILMNAAAVYGLLAILRPPEFIVGLDGIEVRVSLWRYFVAYRDLATIDADAEGLIALRYHNGRRQTFYASVGQKPIGALVTRIRAAMHNANTREAPIETLHSVLLERGDRSLDGWREALDSALNRPAGYRDDAVTSAELVRVLANPDAPATRRIGAALALKTQADPAVATQIRIAADTSATDELRHALERVLDDTLSEDAVLAAEKQERTRRRL